MSMAYSVGRTLAFEEDLRSTVSYLIEQLGSSQAASKLFDEVERAIDILGETPFVCAPSRKPCLRGRGYREYLLDDYVIVYKVEGNEVWLLRLFHQKQLYERFVMDWG